MHELGHQFDLDHSPKNGQTGSPYHTSLMNYDYSYSFNGSDEAIHYSQGKFESLQLKETNLTETLDFPAADLEFLSKAPYFFRVKPNGNDSTHVDWNRNGIFGEEQVKADINDGYSLTLRGNQTLDFAAGSPTLVEAGDYLALITPILKSNEEYGEQIWRLTDERPGLLRIALFNGRLKASDVTIAEGILPLTGDPSAVCYDNNIYVSTPIAKGFQFLKFSLVDGVIKLVESRTTLAESGAITVVKVPEGVRLLRWNERSGSVSLSNWERNWEKNLPGIISEAPVAATWNSKKNCLALVETVQQDEKKKRLRIAHVFGDLTFGFQVTNRLWVEGFSGWMATQERPVIIFDESPNRGPNGGYNVYAKRLSKSTEKSIAFVARQIEDPKLSDGWRVRMVGNEWAEGMNAPAACFYKNDIAYAYRLGFGNGAQKIALSLNASGIEDRIMTDFNEVNHIFTTGLMESLRRVQREYGLIPRD